MITISHISADIFASFPFEKYTRIFILADENTRACCLPLLLNNSPALAQACILEIPSGEAYKTLDTCEKIWQQLFDMSADRNALLINLGGGVITDMGGLIASLYKRGIDFINIPTTLLAMVDAAVGGKTGIDCFGIKNGIGLFSEPKHIFICPEFLNTLPETELLSGYAEVIKHALIYDNADYRKQVLSFQLSDTKNENLLQIIRQSVHIKTKIVEADFRETGLRKVLNFGHTIGHAIESFALQNNTPIPHGYAVAYGIIGALQLSRQYCNLSSSYVQEAETYLLNSYSGKIKIRFLYEDLKPFLLNDKKNKSDKMLFVLLKELGKPVYNIACNEQDVKKAVSYLAELL